MKWIMYIIVMLKHYLFTNMSFLSCCFFLVHLNFIKDFFFQHTSHQQLCHQWWSQLGQSIRHTHQSSNPKLEHSIVCYAQLGHQLTTPWVMESVSILIILMCMELKSYLCDLTEKESEQSNTHVFPVDELMTNAVTWNL